MVNLLAPFQRRRASRPRILTATDGRDILINDPAGWEVTAPWLWWTGPANSDGTGGPFGNPPPGAENDPCGPISVPAVTRCTSIICDTIAGLPWKVFRGWELQPDPSWISDPQALRQDGRVTSAAIDEVKLSAVEFWTEWLVSALWFGDGYVYVPVRGVDGMPQPPLWNLNPNKVVIDNGRYWLDDYEFPPGTIIHLRGNAPYVKGHGTGVLTRHGMDLALSIAVRQYAAGQYSSGIPYGYLKSSQPRMDATQATDLKTKWLSQHGGNTRSIAVLNATTEFVPLAISPLDAQLDNARQWSLRDVAMAFGVPAYMLGVPGDSSTYANVESRHIELRQFTLLPWIRRAESTLDAQFPRGTELKIVASGLERADTATRYAAYKTALDSGIMTRDEVRALENLPPLGATADPSVPDQQPQTQPVTAETPSGVTP
jgi:HK97 family phage portal protein